MSNYNNPRKSLSITVGTALPGERKLVLKRLKPPPPHLVVWSGVSQWLWILALASLAGTKGIKKALLFTAGLLRKPELVRHIGPGYQPEPEHLHRKSHFLI